MKQVRWLAPRDTHRRVLSAADFKQLGVDHPSDETFSKANNFVVLMEDDACETLVAKLPDEFEVLETTEEDDVMAVTEGEGSPDETTELAGSPDALDSSPDSAPVNPDGSSSESVVDEQAEGASSPSKAGRKR